MPVLRRRLLVFGALLWCSGASAAAVDALDACAAQAPPESRGIVALETACPGLESALHETGLARNLPEGWRESLGAGAVHDLVELTRHYSNPPAQTAMDPAALAAILHQLESEQIQPKRSWWDALREWLRSRFAGRETKPVPWLDRLLDGLERSADVIAGIAYVLLAVVVVGAVTLIVKEFRMAGVMARRGETGSRGPSGDSPTSTPEQGMADLDSAALADQPAILLRLLVARLLATGQLKTERNLTHRELVARSMFADAGSRARFATVAQLAERILYGAGDADAFQTRAVVADGRELLLGLQVVGSTRQ